jgi:two-component system sensor histidine kinase/response regulator
MAPRAATAIIVFCIGAFAVVLAAWMGVDHAAIAALSGLAIAAAIVAGLAMPGRSDSLEVTAALADLDARLDEAAKQRHEMRMRAETAGRFREEFVAAVRHELKTPLNAILGFTEVLLGEIDGPLSPQQREDVAAIRQAGIYLSELVEAVLEEWAPEEQETPLPVMNVDLDQLVREVARLLQGQAAAKNVAIRVEVQRGVASPLGDARRLRQVLINLGTNAVRATSKGSVTLTAENDPEGVRITVRDTGRGIASEDLGRLFDEYAQAGSASSREGGVGLGLAITRDLVEWHGGRLEVETMIGEGSAFHVILPLELD